MEAIEVPMELETAVESCPEALGEELVIETSEYIEDDDEETRSISKCKPPYLCTCCRKSFTRLCNLRRHAKKAHGSLIDFNSHKNGMKCGFDAVCHESFNRVALYRDHLIRRHQVKLEKMTRSFNCLDEFYVWKAKEEHETESRFIKIKKEYLIKNSRSGVKKVSFDCCRSGKHFMKGTKRKGTIKIGTYCPASMEILHNNRKVVLTYYKTHVGHGSINEVYITSEKKRKQGAIRRQRQVYNAIKSEVKAKLEKAMMTLCENIHTIDYLKALSKKLDTVFDIENDNSSTAEKDPKICLVQCPDVKSSIEGAETTKPKEETKNNIRNGLEEHGYVSKKSPPIQPKLVSSGKEKIEKNDAAVYTERSSLEHKVKLQNKSVKNGTNPKQMINLLLLKTPEKSVIKGTNCNPSLKNAQEPNAIKDKCPVIIYNNKPGDVSKQKVVFLQSSVNCITSYNSSSCVALMKENSVSAKASAVSNSKGTPPAAKTPAPPSALKCATLSNAQQLSKAISTKNLASGNAKTVLLKQPFNLLPANRLVLTPLVGNRITQQYAPVQSTPEEKKKALVSLWTSYRNS